MSKLYIWKTKKVSIAKIGVSSINNVELVCFLSATGITHLMERAKARASTSRF